MIHLARLLVHCVLGCSAALAGPTPTLRYTGTLSDAGGRPLAGTYLLRFHVYDEAGRPSWSEALYVKADQGRFAALLGRQRPLPGAVLSGAYRLGVEAPPGTGWTARAEGLPVLDRAVSAAAFTEPTAARPPAVAAAPPAAGETGRLERELAAAKAEAERARRDTEESRRRLDALERAVAAPAQAAPAGPSIYVVQPGDTLRTVAARALGDERQWITIYQANHDRLQRAGELTPGQKLVIPPVSR